MSSYELNKKIPECIVREEGKENGRSFRKAVMKKSC